MTFTKITNYSDKLPGTSELFTTTSKYDDFDSAQTSGLHESCLNIVTNVNIYGEHGEWMSTWNQKHNHWIVFKDAKGNFTSPKNYFERIRIGTEKLCFSLGYNIRIRGTESRMKLHAGKEVIAFHPTMLFILRNVVEDVWLDGAPLSEIAGGSDEFDEEEPLSEEEKMANLALTFKRELETRS